MDNNNPIKYSDLIKPDSSIDDLIKKLDELSDSYMNVYENIKKNALAVKGTLEGVSGATEAGRQTIRKAAADTDELTKALQARNKAEAEANVELQRIKTAIREANNIAKLRARLIDSEEGSYDRLSAQYSLNKIALNAMTAEERSLTEEGKQLEKETAEIYERMKELQAATGRTSLNVGNYEASTKSLRTQIMDLTQELVQLRMEGKADSEEYQQVVAKAAELKDAFRDAQAEVKNMAADTSTLNSVLGGMAAAGGGFATVTGAMSLFDSESEDVQEAQKKLQATIAITNGLTAIQAQLQHQSNLMLGIGKIQTLAKAKAEQLATKQTVAATVAQKAFNAVAKANPYVLLATALMTVVGALVAFSTGASEAAKEQKKLNDAQKSWLEYLDYESGKIKEVSDERVKGLQRELSVAQARKASTEEIRKIEDDLLAERIRANGQQQGFYANEIANLDKNKAKLDELHKTLNTLNEAKARGDKRIRIDVDLDGKVERVKIDDAIEAIQGQIDNTGKAVDIAVNLTTEGKDINADAQKQAAQRAEEDKALQRSVTDTLRQAEDERLKLITNGYDRQRAQSKAATARAIADIQYQLDNEVNLTDKQKKALNEVQVSLRKQLKQQLADIDKQQAAAELATTRETEDMLNNIMAEGIEKQRTLLDTEYTRRLEDLNNRLKQETDLTKQQRIDMEAQLLLIQAEYDQKSKELEEQHQAEMLSLEAENLQMQIDLAAEGTQQQLDLRLKLIENQRQQELAANRQLAEDKRKDETLINAKYDQEALQARQDFLLAEFDLQQQAAAAEFDTLEKTERQKTKFRLEQEKARLKKVLELNATASQKMSDVEVKIIEDTIKRINNEIASANVPRDIYDVFGLELTDDKKAAISTSMQYALDALYTWMDARVEAANQAVENTNREVEAAQRAYELELQAKANGYAADVETAKKELELQKENQKKALEQQQKAQEDQAKIQALQQVGDLVTASALIWSQLGFPWAIPALAIMWGSFAASKLMARNAVQEQYAEGTVELLQGGSHQSGHDVDLGTKPDGTRRRAEGGEFFAVINKRNSRRFRKEIPQVIGSLNDGTFADKYLNRFNVGNLSVATNESQIDLLGISDDVAAIREQNAQQYIMTPKGMMIRYKNVKRTIIEA
jgi:hypothetical protein